MRCDRRQTVRLRTSAAGSAVMALLAGVAPASAVSLAASTIGRTWPIVEPDALAQIDAKVATLPRDLSPAFGPPARWSALKAAPLAIAPADSVRTVIPFYSLEFDVTLPDGRTLYPKGFTFNPLTFVTMPQRLVVVHPRDLGWALRVAHPTDFILLAAQGAEQGDPIALTQQSKREIYILEERVKARLGLTVAPVIVAQSGQKLVLTAFGPRSRNTPPAAAMAPTGAAR